MDLRTVLKHLTKALPVIIANAPVIAASVREVLKALRKPEPLSAEPVTGSASAE